MNFYRMGIEIGKRKRFSYAISFGEYPSIEIKCDKCGITWDK
jgi:hypothetical protein